VVSEDHGPDGQAATLQVVEKALANEGVVVSAASTVESVREVYVAHLYIIVSLLMIMALLTVVVGGLGLMSTMSLNVLERQREIGVMRAVGATSRKVLQVILGEGVFIGLLSWGLAIILSIPLTPLIGNATGMTFIEMPLLIAYFWWGVVGWLGLVVILTIVASFFPARTATRIPVNEVLAYE